MGGRTFGPAILAIVGLGTSAQCCEPVFPGFMVDHTDLVVTGRVKTVTQTPLVDHSMGGKARSWIAEIETDRTYSGVERRPRTVFYAFVEDACVANYEPSINERVGVFLAREPAGLTVQFVVPQNRLRESLARIRRLARVRRSG
jgi:hypothetical protein